MTTEPTFAAVIEDVARAEGFCLSSRGAEPLAELGYPEELTLKDKALRRFWELGALAGEPETVIASPRPRHYRTTSKRLVVLDGRGCRLVFIDGSAPAGLDGIAESQLEPPEHAAIFQRCAELLACHAFASTARCLNYLIIRGSYREWCLIFNANTLDRHVVNRLKALAGELQAASSPVASAFIYFDPTRSPYYLELERPKNRFQLKRLFGRDQFRLSFSGLEFQVPVTSFSQVNESILPGLLDTAKELLAVGDRQRLLDLYCGYGLFSCGLGNAYPEVIGVEAAPQSIAAAIDHGRSCPHRGKMIFRRLQIARGNLASILPRAGSGINEDVILDPPRRGVDTATIRAIAQRRPRQILHVFCSVDEIPRSLAAWASCRYLPKRIVPLDMFPGTANLEILLLLTPAAR